jgi:diguanylate cyclase
MGRKTMTADDGHKGSDRIFQQAGTVAGRVLPFLKDKRIPATPENYMLWYEYFQGNWPELTKRLDELLDAEARFTPELTRQIFDEFFGRAPAGPPANGVNQAAEIIQGLALRIIKESVQSVERVTALSDSLARYEAELEKARDLDDIRRVLTTILSEGQRVREANQAYQKAIHRQTQMVDTALGRLKSLELEATTDVLTGMANRRAFDREIEREYSRAKRYGNVFGLIFSDLDDFKKVNDVYGPQVGDSVLREVARLTRHIVREMDFPARYGGQELAIIVPGTDLEGTRRLAERLRLVVASTGFSVDEQHEFSLTISLGVAVFDPEDQGPADIVRRADLALHVAKRRGKNKVGTEAELDSARNNAAASGRPLNPVED